ncbi:MAG: phosphoglucomutase [Euryarchaeota archaeon]|nr:phosphoglucomutase [Euryarchaeota archaeon]
MTVFRAYDVRGVYEKELTKDIARKVGSALGSYLPGGRITLGRDTRESGPSLERAFLEGVLGTGCDVESYGVLPIPVLSYLTLKTGCDAAAYISASHNPPEYNGIRFRTAEGYGMLYHQTEMMTIYEEGTFREGEGIKTDHAAEEAIEVYGDYVSEKLDLGRPLKVVLDMGNGAACNMGPLYRRLGFDPLVLNGEANGRFPGRGPSPTEEALQEAARTVVATGAGYGVGFDPDADRGLVIDDLGRIVPPEKIAIILAKKRYRPGDVVIAGFDCSMIIERELEPAGITVLRERVGDVYVANRVKNEGAVLGVERSAHFFLPEFQYSDDPFAMSFVLGEVIAGGEKLSTLSDEIPDYPYLLRSIEMDRDPKEVMARLEDELAHMAPDTTDGLKITTDSYSVLIRPSNTEPMIRLYLETTKDDLDELTQRYEGQIRSVMKTM